MIDDREKLARIESLIKQGQMNDAAQKILRLRLSGIDRLQAAPLANLARRCGLAATAVRVLKPYVRPRKRLLQGASAFERSEYAAALQKIGSVGEALRILQSTSPESYPQALLFEAFCHFSQWNYAEAVPVLRRFLSLVPKASYQLRIGQVNLAAALVYLNEQAEAEDLLAELRDSTRERKEFLLLGNSLEISSQLALAQKKPKAAHRFLDEAARLIRGRASTDSLYINKWQAVLEAIETGRADRLEELARLAHEMGDDETVRDLDYWRAVYLHDESSKQRLLFLYFGTPYPSYRKRILAHIDKAVLPESLERGPTGAKKSIDPYQLSRSELVPGNLTHALLCFLLRDAYRGARVGEIFSSLYPTDYYDPDSSPERVYQIVKRLRQLLKTELQGMTISGRDVYRLELNRSKYRVTVPREPFPLSPEDIQFEAARRRLLPEGFRSKDLQEVFSISKRSATRLVERWSQSGRIARVGSGNKVKYRITDRLTGKADKENDRKTDS